MSNALITPSYLFDYSLPASFDDYRPVVGGFGSLIIFERSAVAAPNDTMLYVTEYNAGQASSPQLFLQGSSLPQSASRPDWCWKGMARVAFSGLAAGSNDLQIGIVPDSGYDPSWIANTKGMEYPVWFPDAKQLAVMNFAHPIGSEPLPNTTVIDEQGHVVASAIAGSSMWAGMPSVSPASPNLIAFAGQPVGPGKYDQDMNYIWVIDTNVGPSSLQPLEYGCPSSGKFDVNFQGRAPWWSPDGRWVVFESYRQSPPSSTHPLGLYAIWLYDTTQQKGSAVQLTDPAYNANHAKWFPNGFPGGPPDNTPMLIVAIFQPGESRQPPAWPWGLATLDMSSFVSPS
jgi:WD40 repeat protein